DGHVTGVQTCALPICSGLESAFEFSELAPITALLFEFQELPAGRRAVAQFETQLIFMLILGINAYHGDAAAAIVRDGQLVAAVEEERLNRRKHCAGFPTESIRYCLSAAGASIETVD